MQERRQTLTEAFSSKLYFWILSFEDGVIDILNKNITFKFETRVNFTKIMNVIQQVMFVVLRQIPFCIRLEEVVLQ